MGSEARTGARASRDQLRAMLDDVCRALDEDITFLGLTRGGEVGAAYVRRADGRESVLSFAPGIGGLRPAGTALDLARRNGLPVPRYEDVVETTVGVALLQDRLPGRGPDRIDDALVDQLLALVDRFRHLLHAGPQLDPPNLYLTSSGPGFCVHESLEQYSAATRTLLGWVRQVGNDEGSVGTGDDLVHLDFHPGNVLVDDGGLVTGVIDWDAAGRGDARLGYSTLLFDLDHGRRFVDGYAELSDAAVERVGASVKSVELDRRRMFWAHMSLRQVDWSIRFHSRQQVEHYLDYAFAGIERFGLS